MIIQETPYKVAIYSKDLNIHYLSIPYFLFESLKYVGAYNTVTETDKQEFKDYLLSIHHSMIMNYCLFNVEYKGLTYTLFYEHRFTRSIMGDFSATYESVIKCNDESFLSLLVETMKSTSIGLEYKMIKDIQHEHF